MFVKAKVIAMTVLLVVVYGSLALAQAPPHTILNVNLENGVNYANDVSDASTFATNPDVTPAAAAKNFQQSIAIFDIVSVNGQPAKGVTVINIRAINLRTAPTPGQAIGDLVRGNTISFTFELLRGDGTPIGSIMAAGLGAGDPPPGAPLALARGNNAIVGGTGAFLGARGQVGQGETSQTGTTGTNLRQASITEDPANRRQNGGGARQQFVLDVIPMSVPQIVATAGGPAVTHSTDFSQVTSSKPAAEGEILSVFVTGLGPTKPSVDPGKPFPTSPLAVVNSPVEVTVSGRPAEVLAAVGYPGAVDGYQVNFRVPPETARGTATIQITAAWIAGPEVRIAIQ